MKRLLTRLIVFLGSAAAGLVVAAVVLDRFSLKADSFVVEIVVFAILQGVFSIVIPRAAVLGAVGLVSTFLALLLTRVFTNGLLIRGVSTWIFATLIVWIVTLLATMLLAHWLFEPGQSSKRRGRG